jgi:quercetin dioxygenase-like cupin family protein
VGNTIENPVTREWLTFLHRSDELLELELVFAPGGFVPAMHVHPNQEERFEVLAGSPLFRIGASERICAPGDTLVVPRGTAHRFWNDGPDDARVRIELRPALRMEEVLRESARLGRAGKLNRRGLPDPLRGAVLAREYAAELAPAPDPRILLTRLPPRLLQAALVPLAALGHVLGYRVGGG